ncbi:MAG: hypothetical protein GTN69_13285 [Armatimonadetes bacterium]|nr:hypothetical protein [Armatimonadota bacterium]NIO76815.1 hypothetical protein [Armatimonadota bacterium]NIO97185.1 hypothetical protein [Armatimonadota bacterium]
MARRLGIWFVVLFPWLLGALMIWYAWPRTPSIVAQRPGLVIIAPNPDLLDKAAFGFVIYWCGAVLFLLSNLLRKRRLWANLYAVLVVIGLPMMMAVGHGMYYMSGPWRDLASLRAKNGTVYHLQYQGVLQGRIYALSEKLERDQFFLNTRVVGLTNGDSPRYWASVVLPKGMPPVKDSTERDTFWSTRWITGFTSHPSRQMLVSSPDGNILVSVYPDAEEFTTAHATVKVNKANLAYDLRTGEYYGAPACKGSKDIEGISPFILIGEDDEPDPGDVEEICSFVEKQDLLPSSSNYHSGVPYIEVLQKETLHPNPHVRLATAQILGHYWQESEKAAEMLGRIAAHDADRKVREAAHSALDLLNSLVEKHRDDLAKIEKRKIERD